MTHCGCHCIKCGSTEMKTQTLGKVHPDGEPDIHHTCAKCGVHFDHLEGDVFESCSECGYKH